MSTTNPTLTALRGLPGAGKSTHAAMGRSQGRRSKGRELYPKEA